MNNCSYRRCFWILIAYLAFQPYSIRGDGDQSPGDKKTAVDKAASPVPAKIVYQPPMRGAPAVRVTGASRGSDQSVASVSVLAPEHVGITTKEQPALFWYQSKTANAKFELTLVEGEKVKPVLEITVDGIKEAGIHRLKLSDHQVKLAPNVEYQWVVALVTDPENRANDIITSGMIKRIEPSAELRDKLRKTDPAGLPVLYAQEGIWCDAVETLSDLIDAQPDNKTLHDQRADLLKQVGLPTAAAFDARLASGK